MVPVRPFNLDELPPEHILSELEHYKEWQHHVGSDCARQGMLDRMTRSFRHTKVGVKYDALLDWRRLESRYAAISAACKATSVSFWTSLRALHDHAKKLGVKEVWIPRPQHTDVMVYDGKSLSHMNSSRLVKGAIPDPDFHAYVVTGEQLTAANRLREREDAYRRRAGVYRGALEIAVESRLKPFIEKNLLASREYHHFHNGVFIISNEERRYVIQSDSRGTIVWVDDCEVFG